MNVELWDRVHGTASGYLNMFHSTRNKYSRLPESDIH